MCVFDHRMRVCAAHKRQGWLGLLEGETSVPPSVDLHSSHAVDLQKINFFHIKDNDLICFIL